MASKKIATALLALALPLAASATEYRTIDRPRQECWNEQVPVQAQGQGYGGAIVGGIAGGILGNQVGGGNGKTIATAVGAMTGAVVGDRMSSGAPSYQYQTVQRCRTVHEQVQVPVVRERVPVVVEPVPVMVAPAPVIERRVYYIEQDEYRPRGHWKHRHHRWHDDDDD
jgi:uncharacterized protein YcfJ